MRRNFSHVARYSLKFLCCSLLVAKSLVTCCKISHYSLHKLLVAKNHSLLVAKFARYSLEKLLVAKNHLLFVAKFACYSLQKLLIEKSLSLLVAEVARCKKLLVTRYEKTQGTNIYLKPNKDRWILFILSFQLTKNRERFRHNKVSIGMYVCMYFFI